jgi:hypothetical protein
MLLNAEKKLESREKKCENCRKPGGNPQDAMECEPNPSKDRAMHPGLCMRERERERERESIRTLPGSLFFSSLLFLEPYILIRSSPLQLNCLLNIFHRIHP